MLKVRTVITNVVTNLNDAVCRVRVLLEFRAKRRV